jgi:hypothetical protein
VSLKKVSETLDQDIKYYDEEYSPEQLDDLKDILDGFEDYRDEEKKQYSTYFRPEETKALKYLALELGDSISISQIIQKATETYQYTEEEIEAYKKQDDRKGSQMSSIHLSPQTRDRHKRTAKSLGLTGNQFYRMCINGVIKNRANSAWMNKGER